jgi:hypothetical protein
VVLLVVYDIKTQKQKQKPLMSTFKPWPSSKLQLAKLQDFKGKMNKLATCTSFGKKNACN